MRRRDFLSLCGGALAGSVLAGCSTAPSATTTTSGSRPTTTAGSGTGSSTSTTSTTAVPSDLSGLARAIRGELVLPSSAGYTTAVQSYNPVFDGAHPLAVAYVESAADIAEVVGYGRDRNVPLSVRSGGHCYGGWSTGRGIVIDVTRLDAVSVSGGTVTAGSGTRLVDFYAAMAPHGIAVPGGSCPTVGLAGLALGGGLGVLDRKLGLTSDNMVGAEVVLASGDVVTCSDSSHSDLFWALRGAGGGSFGVVTRMEFRSSSIGELGLVTLVWPFSAAPRAVAAWQQWAPHGPDELWSNCLLLASQNTPAGTAPVARITGVYYGAQAQLQALVDTLISEVGSQPFDNFVGSAAYLQTMLIEGGCEGDTLAECHLPSVNPHGILTRAPFAAKSDFVSEPLSTAAIGRLLAAVESRETSPVLSGGGIALDAAGGAVNRVAADATAFVHRDALFSLQYSANWPNGASSSLVQANRNWLKSAWESMRPYVNGQAYQNYADPELTGWAEAYYGSNLPRLEQVKAAYDPNDLWKFPQSIPLPGS